MRVGGIAIFCWASAEVAELVDALDLGSSGAIRGGSSPPFRIWPPFEPDIILKWRSYEAKERNPRLFEKEKEFPAAQRARQYQDSAARADSAGRSRRQAAGNFHEVGSQRFLIKKTGSSSRFLYASVVTT